MFWDSGSDSSNEFPDPEVFFSYFKNDKRSDNEEENDVDSCDDLSQSISKGKSDVSQEKKKELFISEIFEKRKLDDQASKLLSGFSPETNLLDLSKEDDVLESSSALDESQCMYHVESHLSDIEIIKLQDSHGLFDSSDLSLASCGYVTNPKQTYFEQALMHISPSVLSSQLPCCLTLCQPHCITDHRSFMLYLFRTVAVSHHVSSINTAIKTISNLLASRNVGFSSSIFLSDIKDILLNFGLDCHLYCPIKSLPEYILMKRAIKQKTVTTIEPFADFLLFNLNKVLLVLSDIIACCKFLDSELSELVLLLLWISIDTKLQSPDLFQLIQKCLDNALEKISPISLENLSRTITKYVFSVETLKIKFPLSSHCVKLFPVSNLVARMFQRTLAFDLLNSMCTTEREKPVQQHTVGALVVVLEAFSKKLNDLDANVLFAFLCLVDFCIGYQYEPHSKAEYEKFIKMLKSCEPKLPKDYTRLKEHISRVVCRVNLLMPSAILRPNEEDIEELTDTQTGITTQLDVCMPSTSQLSLVKKEAVSDLYDDEVSTNSQDCSSCPASSSGNEADVEFVELNQRPKVRRVKRRFQLSDDDDDDDDDVVMDFEVEKPPPQMGNFYLGNFVAPSAPISSTSVHVEDAKPIFSASDKNSNTVNASATDVTSISGTSNDAVAGIASLKIESAAYSYANECDPTIKTHHEVQMSSFPLTSSHIEVEPKKAVLAEGICQTWSELSSFNDSSDSRSLRTNALPDSSSGSDSVRSEDAHLNAYSSGAETVDASDVKEPLKATPAISNVDHIPCAVSLKADNNFALQSKLSNAQPDNSINPASLSVNGRKSMHLHCQSDDSASTSSVMKSKVLLNDKTSSWLAKENAQKSATEIIKLQEPVKNVDVSSAVRRISTSDKYIAQNLTTESSELSLMITQTNVIATTAASCQHNTEVLEISSQNSDQSCVMLQPVKTVNVTVSSGPELVKENSPLGIFYTNLESSSAETHEAIDISPPLVESEICAKLEINEESDAKGAPTTSNPAPLPHQKFSTGGFVSGQNKVNDQFSWGVKHKDINLNRYAPLKNEMLTPGKFDALHKMLIKPAEISKAEKESKSKMTVIDLCESDNSSDSDCIVQYESCKMITID